MLLCNVEEFVAGTSLKREAGKKKNNKTLIADLHGFVPAPRHLECCLDEVLVMDSARVLRPRL